MGYDKITQKVPILYLILLNPRPVLAFVRFIQFSGLAVLVSRLWQLNYVLVSIFLLLKLNFDRTYISNERLVIIVTHTYQLKLY